MQLTIVSEDAVRRVATRPLVLEAVRAALVSAAHGDGTVLPVVLGVDPAGGGSFGIKAGYASAPPTMGFKYGSYFPCNRERGLPSHGSTTMLVDPETGIPKAVVNAGYLNGLRTAAADAAAVDVLADPTAQTLGVIGAGAQAQFEVRAIAEVRPLRAVRIWNRDPLAAERLRSSLADLPVEVSVTGRAEAITSADIIVTATASREPLVMAGEVKPGAHISAMGADQTGKQELDPALVAGCGLFADLREQSLRIGEFQHAVREGFVRAGEIRLIGDAIADPKSYVRSDDRITIFDSSGIALQDLYVAQAVLTAAEQQGLVHAVDF